ncbi:MAG: hypothetical protein EOP32_25475 [Rhodococcus sp. (in: high G+C Gram-positive bacteria)]|nr:MAG: hypothetical protein EOP32_25475 [Rhodococcus sp. (in: high G+C Gram-positive bacteria)]
MPTLDAKDSVEQPDTPGRTITHAHTPPAATKRNSQRQHQRIGAFGLSANFPLATPFTMVAGGPVPARIRARTPATPI